MGGASGAVKGAEEGVADVGADVVVFDTRAIGEGELNAAAFVTPAAAAVAVGEFRAGGADGMGKGSEFGRKSFFC